MPTTYVLLNKMCVRVTRELLSWRCSEVFYRRRSTIECIMRSSFLLQMHELITSGW